MLLNDEITLYKVKAPLSSLALHRKGPWNEISFILHDAYVGTIKVPLEDTQMFLLNLCADTRTILGTISNGAVEWHFDPSAFGFDVVIDSLGNLHRVEEL